LAVTRFFETAAHALIAFASSSIHACSFLLATPLAVAGVEVTITHARATIRLAQAGALVLGCLAVALSAARRHARA
jgi:hypothetical protein